MRGEELRDLGYGGLWGVGQAAEEAPALVVLSYDPAQGEGGGVATANPESVAWVGKGIVYDTGGLSLKVRKKKYCNDIGSCPCIPVSSGASRLVMKETTGLKSYT